MFGCRLANSCQTVYASYVCRVEVLSFFADCSVLIQHVFQLLMMSVAIGIHIALEIIKLTFVDVTTFV